MSALGPVTNIHLQGENDPAPFTVLSDTLIGPAAMGELRAAAALLAPEDEEGS